MRGVFLEWDISRASAPDMPKAGLGYEETGELSESGELGLCIVTEDKEKTVFRLLVKSQR